MSTPTSTSFEVDTLVAWITRSDVGYMEGVHQTCLLLGRAELWNDVARRLVACGHLTMEQRRWTSGLDARPA